MYLAPRTSGALDFSSCAHGGGRRDGHAMSSGAGKWLRIAQRRDFVV
jgi:hypothetical protein